MTPWKKLSAAAIHAGGQLIGSSSYLDFSQEFDINENIADLSCSMDSLTLKLSLSNLHRKRRSKGHTPLLLREDSSSCCELTAKGPNMDGENTIKKERTWLTPLKNAFRRKSKSGANTPASNTPAQSPTKDMSFHLATPTATKRAPSFPSLPINCPGRLSPLSGDSTPTKHAATPDGVSRFRERVCSGESGYRSGRSSQYSPLTNSGSKCGTPAGARRFEWPPRMRNDSGDVPSVFHGSPDQPKWTPPPWVSTRPLPPVPTSPLSPPKTSEEEANKLNYIELDFSSVVETCGFKGSRLSKDCYKSKNQGIPAEEQRRRQAASNVQYWTFEETFQNLGEGFDPERDIRDLTRLQPMSK